MSIPSLGCTNVVLLGAQATGKSTIVNSLTHVNGVSKTISTDGPACTQLVMRYRAQATNSQDTKFVVTVRFFDHQHFKNITHAYNEKCASQSFQHAAKAASESSEDEGDTAPEKSTLDRTEYHQAELFLQSMRKALRHTQMVEHERLTACDFKTVGEDDTTPFTARCLGLYYEGIKAVRSQYKEEFRDGLMLVMAAKTAKELQKILLPFQDGDVQPLVEVVDIIVKTDYLSDSLIFCDVPGEHAFSAILTATTDICLQVRATWTNEGPTLQKPTWLKPTCILWSQERIGQ